ncbi:E-selectin-like [Toxotes jaculatrix]|uniref:E-selectin-like n=1 Tax=Toxotes jaculatrix TaxID=941984 RepID=UPI001B3AFC10|nr:E-selectin-like [Toxotes jaculatrix]
MVIFCGLLQTCGSKSSSTWISLTLLFSMLCMWTSVECWSYHFSDTTMNWQDARAWCKEYYTDMVAIQNQEEIKHLNNYLPRKPTYYWIGIRKINDVWTWVGTNKALTAEATNWAKGEPNNGKNELQNGASEDCVEMYIKREQQQGKWNDERCEKLKTALCYTAACKNNSCYHGECVETINSHECACFEGFYGEKCEQVVQCDKAEVTVPHKGSVKCTHVYGNFSYNSSCEYSCEKGYQLTMSRPLRCTASKNWSEQPPTCELVQCPKLSRPTRGSINCSDPLGPSSYQSTCVLTCDEGYAQAGLSSTTLQCEASGSWNASQLPCVAVQCPALQKLENGVVSCGHADERFIYGNTCSFSCAPGYRLVGPSSVTCTSAAEWSETMPRCEAITCQNPKGDAHLVPKCSQSSTELWTGSSCSFSCEEGFELQGADIIQCSQDGQWSKAIPTCKAVQCPALQKLENGVVSCGHANERFIYGNTCSFSCAPGYRLVGPSSVTCTSAAEWSETMPRCEAVQCPALQKLENGVVSCGHANERFIYGNTCSFSCAPGYRLVGPSSVTCTSAAEWSETMPRCEATRCPVPEIPTSGHISCSPSLSSPVSTGTSYPLGMSCTFSCDEGYELKGALSMECEHPGQWSTTPPSCTVISCPLFTAPENGHINCSNSEPIYNSQCSFTCSQDYSLDGHELLTCDRHGNWTGERPTCKASPSQNIAVVSGVAAGGTLLSGLTVAMWILKRLKKKATKFELNSNSDIEAPPQVYKNSTDSLL